VSHDAPAWLISVERVHSLHAYALERWGGSAGIRNAGCVEGSIGNSVNAALYAMETGDEEPDVLTVAAHVLFYLARNHCYTDGNKRIAWLAFTDQIAVLGLDVDATQADVEGFVLNVASGTVTNADAVRAWIAPRLVARP
jgi:death on curing protein